MNELIYDTETSGLPDFKRPAEDTSAHPHIVQLGAILYDDSRHVVAELNLIVKPDGWKIPDEAAKVHGITQERAERFGLPIAQVMDAFLALAALAKLDVAHNHDFDEKLVRVELYRLGRPVVVDARRIRPAFCTMKLSTDILQLPGKYGFKWPSLQEAHTHFLGKPFDGAHDAMADVRACAAVYFAMNPLPAVPSP